MGAQRRAEGSQRPKHPACILDRRPNEDIDVAGGTRQAVHGERKGPDDQVVHPFGGEAPGGGMLVRFLRLGGP